MKRRLVILTLVSSLVVCAAAGAFAYVIQGSERDVDTIDVRIGGKQYILLIDLSTAYGIDWEWDSISRKIFLRKNGREVVFLVGSKYYFEGKTIKKLNTPVCMKNGSVYIPLKFAKYSINRLFGLDRPYSRSTGARNDFKGKPEKAKRSSIGRYKIKKVVIDPGHGGKDPGAIGRTRLYEKNVVLDVSKRIKRQLEKKGIEVVMTRTSDRFISLAGRAKIANKRGADLFVSIHANASKARWMRGFEVYYLSEATDDNARAIAAAENSVLKYENDSLAGHTKNLDAIIWDLTFTENREEAIELAGFICQEVGRKLKLRKQALRSAGFYVLKGAEMPAVLVELSYLSNSWDEKNLKKSSYRQKLAEGVTAGILGYKKEYEITNGFSQ